MKIGMFDSGFGGFSLVRELHSLLPGVSVLYFDDGANSPYGTKSPDFIVQRSLVIAEHLVLQGATALLVACNTATTQAISTLRQHFNIPIFGIEPAVKPAAEMTKEKKIAIAATESTLYSERFAELCKTFAADIKVLSVPCPEWVTLVEEGELFSEKAVESITRSLSTVLKENIDVLALGCTHFSFLRSTIETLIPATTHLIDPTHRVVMHLIRSLGLAVDQEVTCSNGAGALSVWTSRSEREGLRKFLELSKLGSVADFHGGTDIGLFAKIQ
jgi:glutamate racemase